jgi:hypothetical protein
MWGWFGGGASQSRRDGPKNAILLLRRQLDMLQKRERHLESQMGEQDAIIKKHLTTNKTGNDRLSFSLGYHLLARYSEEAPGRMHLS